MITADDCEPEFPAVSLTDDETDSAVENAIVTIEVRRMSDVAVQCPEPAHIPWKPVMITCVTNPMNRSVNIQKILDLKRSNEDISP